LSLIKQTIFYDPAKNCLIRGGQSNWAGLPKSKSLFFARQGHGLPIGNLTSQLFGNVYLSDFDYFVKGGLKIKYYGRYVDDMVFVHKDKEYLKKIISLINEYLINRLDLKLHDKKIYLQHFSKGIKFLGVSIKPHRIYIDKRSKGNFYKKIRDWNNHLVKNNNTLSQEDIKRFIAVINSYLGLMKHYKTQKLRQKMFDQLSVYFWNYVYIKGNILKKR